MKLVRTTLLIPCYNEEESIPHLCARLAELVDHLKAEGPIEVLFVDDGSRDATGETIARYAGALPYRILTHEQNRGLGAALKTGFAESRGDEIVTLDSDCTYDPLQALSLLACLREGYDVVTGSPYHPQGEVVNVVRWRLWLSKGLSFMYWTVLPVRLHTYTSCFRAYRRNVIALLDAPDNGFLAVTQLLVSAILRGVRVAEVPARLTTRTHGTSKIRIVSEMVSHLRFLVRIPFMRMHPRPFHQLSTQTYSVRTSQLLQKGE